jgi:hypothetical protein
MLLAESSHCRRCQEEMLYPETLVILLHLDCTIRWKRSRLFTRTLGRYFRPPTPTSA